MKRGVIILFAAIAIALPVWAQTVIAGYVRDSLTREPLPNVSVALVGTDEGVVSNVRGGFHISRNDNVAALRLSAVGYRSKVVALRQDQAVLVVDLVSQAVNLDEVVVERGREKYSKKDNPAVALARRLMALKQRGSPLDLPHYNCVRYERLIFGFDDYDKVKDSNLLLRKFDFLEQYADTSLATAKRVLPISVRERMSHHYHRANPKASRVIVTGQSSAGIDEQLDTQAGIKETLDEWLREVDVFANDITFLNTRFVSPLSTIAPDFYKFYITDTLIIDATRCIELSFTPAVSESFGFLGRMLVVDGDTSLFVKRVTLGVPHNINLNYVHRLHIVQEFVPGPDATRLKTRDDMEIEFGLLNAPGLFARRQAVYSDFGFAPSHDPSVFDTKGDSQPINTPHQLADDYWAANRPIEGKTDHNTVQQMLERMRQSKSFYWGEKVIVAMIKGYVPTGSKSKWDIGPLNTVISGNSLEGVRLRLGGMSTVNLSRHWFGSGYVAYGFADKRLKYAAQLEYSFNQRRELSQEFPIHSIKLSHSYDIDKLGQRYLYTNPDNMFLTLKRQKDNKMIYRRATQLVWQYENQNHFSVTVALEHLVREQSRFMPFTYADGTRRKSYREAGFSLTLRYAPGEKFYQTRSHRLPISMDAPIMTISHTYMPRGLMGSLYEINKTEAGLQKRFWFSAFGYLDCIVKAGKIWSQVSYPDLLIPNANLSYTIQRESYTLMSAMEFMNDQYLSWDVTYWGNGVVMNRIPLIKRLKLREVFTFRGLWGSLSDRNNPARNDRVFLFPDNALCRTMTGRPYMEIGVGLDNILTVLRVDYVWRLTYRDTPGVDRSGLRLALHFTF